jgi:hypothetical protein
MAILTRKNVDPLADHGVRPRFGPEVSARRDWRTEQGLTSTSTIFDRSINEFLPGADALGQRVALAQPTNRHASRPRSQRDLQKLKKEFERSSIANNPHQMWTAMRDIYSSVRLLNWDKLPAEAMAFYRPFHFPPFSQWGIYLLIAPLLKYHDALVDQSKQSKLFAPEVLIHLILFEIFNHEFFHHLVESTATTLEVLLAAHGIVAPLYLRYRYRLRKGSSNHPHAPLEEALANAYAYNALSFLCRIKVGFKTLTVNAYQKAIQRYWEREPPGYRSAGYYIKGNYVAGGAHLLADLLDKPDSVHDVPLSIIAKHVMPGGFTALKAKPDIPTWLIGSETELEQFLALVPAPNEAYTQLFWPYNTTAIDDFIHAKITDEKDRKNAQRNATEASRAPEGTH